VIFESKYVEIRDYIRIRNNSSVRDVTYATVSRVIANLRPVDKISAVE